MKLMKLEPFTIFLIILGLLVIITLLMNLRDSYKRESFVNFQNHPQASGSSIYIPQYSTNETTKLLSLYDNVYFDTRNGSLIEIFAGSCLRDCQTNPKNITDIVVASRNGIGITAIPTVFDPQGNVKPNATAQSLLTTIDPMYNQYVYTTSCTNTSIYQVLYVSWNKDSYIHIIDISGTGAVGKNIKSFYITPTGVESSQTTFTTPTLQSFSAGASTITENKNSILPSSPDQKYSNGSVSLLQLGKDGNQNGVSYDISNGNIVISNGGVYKVYNRNGNTVNNPQPTNSWEKISTINTFVITDIPGLSVLVTSYMNDTLIQLLVPNNSTHKDYKLLYSYRFDEKSYVTNFESDAKNNPSVRPTSAPTTPVPASTTVPGNLDKNGIANLDGKTSGTSSVCGDDLSCKWYWYFNTIAQKNGNGSTYFSDDYFLKTEAVPPVCPQCPQCPTNGTCNNCGGNGGCGASGVNTKKKPDGSITDKNGNVYIPYTDSSGNTKYMSSSGSGSGSGSSGSGSGSGSGESIGTPKGTYLDSEGNLMTSANPNTVVGGLTTTALGVGQVGTTGINAVGGVANNIVDTAGKAIDSATGLVGGTINSATGLVGGTINSATGLVGGLANTAGNLVGGVVGNTTNMIGNLGNGGQGQGQGQGQGPRQQMNSGSGSAASSLGYTTYSDPNKAAGYTPGYTPIDNYSQYGALQSKGGNYIPVTADFSSFRK